MLVCKNGKLYLLKDNGKLVGVDVYSDKVLPVRGAGTALKQPFQQVSLKSVRLKYGITEDNPYKFPRPKRKPKKDTKVVKGE